MGLVELILTVCTLTQPASCEERHLSLLFEGSLVQCMSQAPPAIAEWANSHPGRRVVKWRCSYPGTEDSALISARSLAPRRSSSLLASITIRPRPSPRYAVE